MEKVRVVVIGSGPAGLTAALYTARAQLSTVVITGPKMGGQIATTHEVDNFPGFPQGIMGPELIANMQAQAERFGAQLVYESVTEVDFAHGSPFTIRTDNGRTFMADAVIATIGANPRELKITGEREFTGRGVSWCATCDGFFFRNKDIIVVGGGDSALQEAIFLTKFANTVQIVHRRDSLRASVALQSRVQTEPKISFVWDTVVEQIEGDGVVNRVQLKNLKTGETRQHATDGVFIFIGYDPNSDVFKGQLAVDGEGYVMIDDLKRTNVEGVFAGGEISDKIFRQAITAAGEGCAAALTAVHWLQDREGKGLLQPLTDATPTTAG
jgi:thioredoxin reductase (NADPH)